MIDTLFYIYIAFAMLGILYFCTKPNMDEFERMVLTIAVALWPITIWPMLYALITTLARDWIKAYNNRKE